MQMTAAEVLAESLFVKRSPVKAGGRARINHEILEKLEIEDGESLVVSSEKKDILVKAYGDDIVEKDKIRLRAKDVEKLGVEEEDEVNIRKHKKLLNKLL